MAKVLVVLLSFLLAGAASASTWCQFNPTSYSGTTGTAVDITVTADYPSFVYTQFSYSCTGSGGSGLVDITPDSQSFTRTFSCNFATAGSYSATVTPQYTADYSAYYNDDCGTATINIAAAADVTAPTISVDAGPAQQQTVTSSSSQVRWSTSENANYTVQYGTTTGYGSTKTRTTVSGTSFSADLTGLTACRAYHYKVVAWDSSGNRAESSDYTFTTTGCAGQTGVTPTASCTMSISPTSLSAKGATAITIVYGDVNTTVLGTSWKIDCGNGKTVSTTCTGTSSSCSASCDYDANGNFNIQVTTPSNVTSLCGKKTIFVNIPGAMNATITTTPPATATPTPTPTGCDVGECLWQNVCYPEGYENPSFNEPGNCAYATCSFGQWAPKPEESDCGGGSICCSAQCKQAECVSDAECQQRVYEGQGCYKFSCQNPGTCRASCEPETLPTNCGGTGCAVGSPDYCDICGAHVDNQCNCGETPEDYPEECTTETQQLVFLLNRTSWLPRQIVYGEPLNITVPYHAPDPIIEVKCEEEGCNCFDLPEEQAILCMIADAKEIDYTLLAKDAKNRTYRTALKITAAGVAAVVLDETPGWIRALYLLGSIAAIVVLIGGAYGTRMYLIYSSPQEEFKRVVKQIESFNSREKMLMGMYMTGKLREQGYAEQKRLMEKEERDALARKKELAEKLGEEAKKLEEAAKEEVIVEKAKAKAGSEEKGGEKPPAFTGKF